MKREKILAAALAAVTLILFSCSAGTIFSGGGKVQEVPFQVIQYSTDTLFSSIQKISMIVLKDDASHRSHIDIAWVEDTLLGTSRLAEKSGALAAVNAGFFDMDKGGNVSYFEMNDSVITWTHPSEQKYGVEKNILNGAVIMTKDGRLIIEKDAGEKVYRTSGAEQFVLVTGPLLISGGEAQTFGSVFSFHTKRHPRSCIAKTSDSILPIAVDGRAENADGMTLYELQEFLLGLGCVDAVNLDGGGSTTLYTRERGIINQPSDSSGERPVANAIIIRD